MQEEETPAAEQKLTNSSRLKSEVTGASRLDPYNSVERSDEAAANAVEANRQIA